MVRGRTVSGKTDRALAAVELAAQAAVAAYAAYAAGKTADPLAYQQQLKNGQSSFMDDLARITRGGMDSDAVGFLTQRCIDRGTEEMGSED